MSGVRVPRAAARLGAAGLLPPAIAIVGEAFLPLWFDKESIGIVLTMPAMIYAAAILSFLGGMWWGLASVGAAEPALGRWLGLAVLPSLVAVGAFFGGGLAPPPWGWAIVLAIGLVGSLLGDLALTRAGLAPRWWMRLRVPLSLLLAAEILAVAALA